MLEAEFEEQYCYNFVSFFFAFGFPVSVECNLQAWKCDSGLCLDTVRSVNWLHRVFEKLSADLRPEM